MTVPFIGLDDLGEYLRMDVDDQLGVMALDSACETVRGYTEQTFNLASDEAVVLDGTGGEVLYLPELPVVDVTSVVVRNADLTPASAVTLVDGTDYILGAGGALHRLLGAVWIEGRQNVYVTYSHGSTVIPSDARMVALQVAARIYDVGMVESENTGSYSATYVNGGGALTEFEKGVLYRYKPVAI